MAKKIRYALWNTYNRAGDFEFLCSTQTHWTSSLTKIKIEKENSLLNCELSVEPPYTRAEVLEEYNPIILKLIVEEIE